MYFNSAPSRSASLRPVPLRTCRYPRAADTDAHGLQPLPDQLPVVRLSETRPHRSRSYLTFPLSRMAAPQMLEAARLVAASYARREPQFRYLQPPARPTAGLEVATHTDAFGTHRFGPWNRESLLYWFIRTLVLTDPSSPRSDVRANTATLEQSLVVLDQRGHIIGAAFNQTMPYVGTHSTFRAGDPILDAVLSFAGPTLDMLAEQECQAVVALRGRYPDFRLAHDDGRVGRHYMVARSEALPRDDTFELVAASAEHHRNRGFAYMLVEATNPWMGAASEALGGVRVHYVPFLAHRLVPASPVPIADRASSPSGCLSDRDGGSMFYIIRLM